jgi:hypothetical protein
VTGTARVVLDPVGAHLEPREIDPRRTIDRSRVGAPLFLTAGGLVIEMAGAKSHKGHTDSFGAQRRPSERVFATIYLGCPDGDDRLRLHCCGYTRCACGCDSL